MPYTGDSYPGRDDVIAYLAKYEQRYALPVVRPVRIDAVRSVLACEEGDDRLLVEASTPAGSRMWRARAVVSATGTWANPAIPELIDVG